MKIYIDEAGGFIAPAKHKSHAYSLVFSLAIPSEFEDELLYEFIHLRDGWPNQSIEIKGSQLDEGQASSLIDLVSKFDVLASYFAIDMATHGDDVVDEFKRLQANEFTANLTEEHHPNIVAEFHRDAEQLRNLPNQLFLQAMLDIELVLELLQEIPLYYSQRLPQELGSMEWNIDAKGSKLTQMEELWTKYILPIGESRFAKTPVIALTTGDYTFYDAVYGVDLQNSETARHLEWLQKQYGTAPPGGPSDRRAVDLRKLLQKRKFWDSRNSLGVQLADMLGSILRRAYNGDLQTEGWKNFGKLLPRARRDNSRIFQYGYPRSSPCALTGHPAEVWKMLAQGAKPMVRD